MDADESMREHAVLEVGADLALNEPSDRSAMKSRAGKKWDELRANDFVQVRLLGLVAEVFGDGQGSTRTRPAG